jgi:ubiquinone/menaquinone biosynthesis C-methylase UbiE
MLKIIEKNKMNFWDQRAHLGKIAGSNDFILKELEINEIKKYIKDNTRILEIGCGNGILAQEIIRDFSVNYIGIDFSAEMINEAIQSFRELESENKPIFLKEDICRLPKKLGKFDLIFSERVLINLDSWDEQKKVIESLTKMLNDKGQLILCESEQSSLDTINMFRSKVELDKINMPWHNRYFKLHEILEFELKGFNLEIIEFTATYYFLSRVINAYGAKLEGKEPSYDSWINKMSFLLPSLGNFGQTKLFKYSKI